jgi:hypothetical protein
MKKIMLASHEMEIQRRQRGRRIKWMAGALKEQLTIANLPQGTALEVSVPEGYVEEFQFAIDEAVQLWKAQKEITSQVAPSVQSAVPTASFSLLDQLNQVHRQGLEMPVTMKDIQEANSAQARLKVLKRIEYLDDLMTLEWKQELVLLLRRDLVADENGDCSLSSSTVIDLIALHRKWFDQGRSSDEYLPIMYDLCENVLQAVTKTAGSDMEGRKGGETANDSVSADSITLICLVQNWQDMWIDLMQRDQYMEDLAESMEGSAMSIFLRGNSEMNRPQQIMAMIDPSAHWFYCWAVSVSPQHLLHVMKSNNSRILADIWSQLKHLDGPTSALNPAQWAIYFHLVSILAIMLVQTRVLQFPWDALISLSPEQQTDGETQQQLLDLFCRTLQQLQKTLNDDKGDENSATLKETIKQGIGVLLSGC